ncbi:hypothetical protein, partial [Bacillus cereus group sp. Bce020]|uniref:hypothetical protein n=1 Tax=Bacillus cereus group sp. Bce020 TaxID=3445246 RepID=UPI003F696146
LFGQRQSRWPLLHGNRHQSGGGRHSRQADTPHQQLLPDHGGRGRAGQTGSRAAAGTGDAATEAALRKSRPAQEAAQAGRTGRGAGPAASPA